MSARMWFLFPLSYVRLILAIILLCLFFNLFYWHSTSMSLHSVPFYTITNNLSNQYSLVNQKLSKKKFPLINRTINIKSSRIVRLAVVSTLYNDGYIEGIEALGHSLRRINIQADLILLYIFNRLNQSTLNRCHKAGWFLYPVERINPPRFAIIYPRFYDQYTKLRVWSMIDYDRVLYLDADTLVIDNIDELLTGIIYENHHSGLIGAVEDVWQGQIGPNFNAGVLLLQPNMSIFNDMLVKMHNMAAYGSYWAEQGFLNWYFKGR